MSRAESAPIAWRATVDGCTRNLGGRVETVDFPNPGQEQILFFRGQYYWHNPVTGEDKKVIGHEIQWSLVPPQYGLLLRQRKFKQIAR